MEYRHEWKHEISGVDLITLRSRLSALFQQDCHAQGGCYSVRSLYFDTPDDRALREKLDGVSRREKFRLRYYGGDTSLIHLEKKVKLAGLGTKVTAEVSVREARAIVRGDTGWMRDDERALIRELYVRMTDECLRPRTVVDYLREPFVYPPGNVRITLDHHIRTGLASTDFLDPGLVTVPAGGPAAVLEVKWDGFLPDIVRDAVGVPGCRTSAFSKYALCRTLI